MVLRGNINYNKCNIFRWNDEYEDFQSYLNIFSAILVSFLPRCFKLCRRFWIAIVTVLTPIFWCWIFFLDGSSLPSHAMRCLYVLAIMATYWMTSVFPLAITSLIPVALFPLLGILSTVRVFIYRIHMFTFHIYLYSNQIINEIIFSIENSGYAVSE